MIMDSIVIFYTVNGAKLYTRCANIPAVGKVAITLIQCHINHLNIEQMFIQHAMPVGIVEVQGVLLK